MELVFLLPGGRRKRLRSRAATPQLLSALAGIPGPFPDQSHRGHVKRKLIDSEERAILPCNGGASKGLQLLAFWSIEVFSWVALSCSHTCFILSLYINVFFFFSPYCNSQSFALVLLWFGFRVHCVWSHESGRCRISFLAQFPILVLIWWSLDFIKFVTKCVAFVRGKCWHQCNCIFFSTYKLSLWLVKLNVLIEEKDRIVAKFLIFTHKHSSLALF